MSVVCYLCCGENKMSKESVKVDANDEDGDKVDANKEEEDIKPHLDADHLLMSSLTSASQTSLCNTLCQIVKHEVPEEGVLCCSCFELLDQYDTFLQKMEQIKEFLIEIYNQHIIAPLPQNETHILSDPIEDDYSDVKDIPPDDVKDISPVNIKKRKTTTRSKNNVKKAKLCGQYISSESGNFTVKKKIIKQKLEASLSCHICLFSFDTLKEKASHLLSEHLSEEKATYTCIICGHHFNNLENHLEEVAKHIEEKDHTNSKELNDLFGDIEKKFLENEIACAKCNIYATSQVGYNYHMNIVHQEDIVINQYTHTHGYQHKCFTCTETFKTKSALKKREMNIHEERTLSCVHCPKSYKTETAFNNHIAKHKESEIKKETSPVDLNRYCSSCKRGFKTVRQFAKHQYSVHAVTVPVDCIQCSPAITFKSEKDLAYHKLQVHSQQASCHQCGKIFFNMSTLENHLKTQHGGDDRFTVICEICTRMFKNQEQLRQHLKTHSDEREFACTLCTRTFKWDSSLNTHIQAAHNKTGPSYPCPTCQRTFKDKNNLKKHQYTHTDEKPHSCDDCGKGFIRKDLLEKHKMNCGDHVDTGKQKASRVRVVEVPGRSVDLKWERVSGGGGEGRGGGRVEGRVEDTHISASEDITTILMTDYKGPPDTVIKLPSSFYIQRMEGNKR